MIIQKGKAVIKKRLNKFSMCLEMVNILIKMLTPVRDLPALLLQYCWHNPT